MCVSLQNEDAECVCGIVDLFSSYWPWLCSVLGSHINIGKNVSCFQGQSLTSYLIKNKKAKPRLYISNCCWLPAHLPTAAPSLSISTIKAPCSLPGSRPCLTSPALSSLLPYRTHCLRHLLSRHWEASRTKPTFRVIQSHIEIWFCTYQACGPRHVI